MPVLENAHLERFCQAIIGGLNKRKAAIHAGYRIKSAASTASKINKYPEVQARIKELQERIDRKVQRAIMSPIERKMRLSEFAGANLIDFIDDNGNVSIDKNQKGVGALSEYTVKKRIIPGDVPVEEVTKTIKLRDPISSIDLLNKMDRIYSEQSAQGNTTNTFNIIVIDGETKDLLAQVKARTQKLIEAPNA